MSSFCIQNFSVHYGKNKILSDLDLSLKSGEFTCILGANGSGKSTLMKAILQTLPHTGTCTYDEKDTKILEHCTPKELGHLLSYLPQKSGLNLSMTVLDVVLMGFNPSLGILQYPNSQMEQKAYDALALLGLSAQANQDYLTLSEGQKQLCLISRLYVQSSAILLLDEPEATLDFEHKHHMLSFLTKLVKEQQKCCLLSIHDPALALQYADKIAILKDGKIQASIYPQIDSKEQISEVLALLYPNTKLIYHDLGGREIPILLPNSSQ